MKTVITEKMRKEAENGKSILKISRTRTGGAKGAIGAGITFLVFALLFGPLFLFAGAAGGKFFLVALVILGIPGLLFVGIGLILQRKKAKGYLKFYEKESGYDEPTLIQVEKELLMPQTVAITNAADYNRRKPMIHCYVTENFIVAAMPGASYVRKLSDMCAAFYSNKIPGYDGPIEGMVLISRQDIAREARTNPYTYRQCGGYIDAYLDKESSAEAAEEIAKRNPSIITKQIFSDGKKEYDLLSMDHWEEDWKAILQML